MQKIFFCFTILFLQCLAINAQVPTSAENLIAEAKKIEIEAKAITQQAIDLRKQATAKKAEAAKEQDNAVATKLKNEATLMEQQAKEKMAEAAVLRNQATEKRKQAAELVKQNKVQQTVTLNPVVSNIPITPINPTIANELIASYVEIYELPNYQGRMVKFATTTENLSLPFPSNQISIKRGGNKLVRIALSTGGLNSKKIEVITSNYPNLSTVNTSLESPPYSLSFLELPFVEIFERPNYQGKSIKFPYQVSKFYPNPEVKNFQTTINNPALPFVSKNVSIRLSDSKLIAYIKVNDLNPLVIHENLSNLELPYERIKSILVDNKVHIVVSLRAILSEIHNNDCKKIYGDVDLDLFTSSSMGGESLALLADKSNINNPWLTIENNPNPIITDKWSFDNNTNFRIKAFSEAKETVQQQNKMSSMLYNINQYFSPYNQFKPFLNLRGDYSNSDFHFIVGNMDVISKAVYMKLKVNLGSAHKGCDVCTDFTWDAAMAGMDIKKIKLNKLGTPTPGAGMSSTYFIGNYRSNISTNGGTNGPLHSTYLQFDDGIFQNFIPTLKQL